MPGCVSADRSVLLAGPSGVSSGDLRRVLEGGGWTVRRAGDAGDCAAVVLDFRACPSLLDVGRLVEDSLARFAAPFVVVVGHWSADLWQRLSALRPVGAVVAPFTPEQLLATAGLAVRGEPGSLVSSETAEGITDLLDRLHALNAWVRARSPRADVRVSATSAGQPPQDKLRDLGTLTGRELAVVRLLASNHRVSHITAMLQIPAATVRSHLRAAFRKCGVRSQAELIEWLRGVPLGPTA